MNISDKTKNVLDAVVKLRAEEGRPPTLRAIAKAAGLSSTWTVRYHLKKLVLAGYIKMKNSISRGIELLKPVLGLPLLGRISAGLPIDAVENIEEHIGGAAEFFGIKDGFALRVKGDSMIGAGIFDGDIVFVKKQATADNGDIVAALIGEEATVKRFYGGVKGIELRAENPKYGPIIPKQVKIMGKVTGVMRKIR
jgi:repressor LexA